MIVGADNPGWLYYVGAPAATVAATVAVAAPFINRGWRKLTAHDRLQAVESAQKKAHKRLRKIEKSLTRNSGTSLFDAVERTENRVQSFASRMDEHVEADQRNFETIAASLSDMAKKVGADRRKGE